MNNKILIAISGIAIIVLSLIFFPSSNSIDHKILEQTFAIDAIYHEDDGYVEIMYQDKSNNTKHVTLEILGMSESFHKEYMSSSFVEKIPFPSAPSYGWQSMPVTLLVEHKKLGTIGIKTEIRPIGQMPAPIIFSTN